MYKIFFCKRDTVKNLVIGKTSVDTLPEAKIFAMACVRKAYTSHRVTFDCGDKGYFGAYLGPEYLGFFTITKL